jgi:hypothetical protein
LSLKNPVFSVANPYGYEHDQAASNKDRIYNSNMRIMARQGGVLDGIYLCTKCGGRMVRLVQELRCTCNSEPEELVAAGIIPSKDASGNLAFDLTAKDQQSIQATQAMSKSMEIDNAYLEKLGLNLDKIREYQVKYGLVP